MSFASIRPDDWNFPLLIHVLGAMVLVGLLAAVAVILVASLRADDRAAALRLAARTLVIGTIPAYLVMRVAAEWIFSKEDLPDGLTWVDIGRIVTDAGLLLLVAILVLVGTATRRSARGDAQTRGLVRPATVLTLLLIAAYAVALWAMATKPG